MRLPPQDVDFDVLDAEFLESFASRWELARALQDWMAQLEGVGDIQEPSEPTNRIEAQRQRGSDARERLIAKRKRDAS